MEESEFRRNPDPWIRLQNYIELGDWEAARTEVAKIPTTHARYGEVAHLLEAISECELYDRIPNLRDQVSRLASSRSRRNWEEFHKNRRRAENLLIDYASSTGQTVSMPLSLLRIFEEASRAEDAEALVQSARKKRHVGDFTEARRLLSEASILDPRYSRISDEERVIGEFSELVDRLLRNPLATPNEVTEAQAMCRDLLGPHAVQGSPKVRAFCEEVNRKSEGIKLASKTSVETSSRLGVTVLGENIPVRILFLAANPIRTDRLRLDEEVRTIEERLRMVHFRDRFTLIQHFAVRTSDVAEYLLRHTPHVVHFSGHGSIQGELILEDQVGHARPVSPAALTRLFRTLKDNIRCVMLNACYSAIQAEAIGKEIDFVVGMSRSITDEAAVRFAAGFYQALGYGRSIQTAFDVGVSGIGIENTSEEATPKLLVKSGLDAASIALVENNG